MDFIGEEFLDERQKAILKLATVTATKYAEKMHAMIHAKLKKIKPVVELHEGVDCILNATAIMTFEAIINLKHSLSDTSKKDMSIFELSTALTSMVTDRLRFHQEKRITISDPLITREVLEKLYLIPEEKLAEEPAAAYFLRVKQMRSTGVKITLADGTLF
jgi:hypothetical protein